MTTIYGGHYGDIGSSNDATYGGFHNKSEIYISQTFFNKQNMIKIFDFTKKINQFTINFNIFKAFKRFNYISKLNNCFIKNYF